MTAMPADLKGEKTMKNTEFTIERMSRLDAMIDEFSLEGCCEVYEFLSRNLLSVFDKKEIEDENFSLSFADEEDHEMFFHANSTEIFYVCHRIERRMENPDGYKEEYDEMKDVMSILCPEDAEEEE